MILFQFLGGGVVDKVNFNDLPWETINTQDMEAKSMDDLPQCQDTRVHNDFIPSESSVLKTNLLPLGKIKTLRTQSFASNIDVNDLPQERFNTQDEHNDVESISSFHTLPHNRSAGLDTVHVDEIPDSQEQFGDDSFIARGSAILWMRASSSNLQGANEEENAQAASSSSPPPAPSDTSGYQQPSRHGGHRSNALPEV